MPAIVSRLQHRQLAVRLEHVQLRLGGRRVLQDIHWRIEPGERWVLLGANGAGKTQLLKLLAGDVWPTPAPRTRRIYQWRGEAHEEPAGVREEIAYVGAERQDRYEHYEWNHRVTAVVGTGLHRSDIPLAALTRADRARIAQLLRLLRITPLAGRRFLQLSYGQRRLVLLARALAWQPGLLLMDELLNGLDADNRQRVLRLIARLSRRRMPWVLSTHRIEDVPPQATHAAILENGRLLRQGPIRQVMGLHWRQRAPAARSAPQRRRAAPAAALLMLRNAWVWLEGRAALKRLGVTIREHECWVVHGPNGAGKSTLIRALYGDLGVASQGELRRRGIEAGVPIAEFKRRVGLVAPELQTQHPLYLHVLEVVVSGLHSSVGLDASPSATERRRALAALRSVGAARLAGRMLRELSYGQQRRVLFARALVHGPDILLLDEPYTGLDAATRAGLQRRIERAAADGTTIIMTTHHREEWPAHTTHELQLADGEARYCGPRRRGP